MASSMATVYIRPGLMSSSALLYCGHHLQKVKQTFKAYQVQIPVLSIAETVYPGLQKKNTKKNARGVRSKLNAKLNANLIS